MEITSRGQNALKRSVTSENFQFAEVYAEMENQQTIAVRAVGLFNRALFNPGPV
jgi:hypothetical protein